MPLRKLLELSSYDPETIESLALAFEQAWQAVADSKMAASPPTRELLAKHIMTAAQEGERSVDRLVSYAVAATVSPSAAS